jgi:hypothetical protein
MSNQTYEERLFIAKQELDLIDKEANTLISEQQKEIDLEKSNFIRQIDDEDYPKNIKELILSDALIINAKFMRETKELMPSILSYNKHRGYIYILVGLLVSLLILSFVKLCII